MRRARGLAFLLVLASMLGLAVGRYAGVFDTGVPVTLRVDRAGSQLAERAEVKVRGLVVGRVQEVRTDGAGATVALSLEPDAIGTIPSNVAARLIPKTLFGEKYVSLVPPERPAATPLGAGDVIGQDRSATARELDRVLDGLLPLLRAVRPQQLATTLGALSQALAGRGDQLGDTLDGLHELAGGLDPALPDLLADVSELADLAGHLDDAAPDLLDALADLSVTSVTVVDQRAALHELIGGLTGASDDLRGFLDANGENLIRLTGSGRSTLASLARYAPEFPCLLGQLAGIVPRIDEAFGAGTDRPGLHVTLEVVANRGKYVPHRDEPRYLDDRGPRCYPVLPLGPQYPPDGPIRDGSRPPAPPTDLAVANSPGEQRLLAELIAAQGGGSPAAVPGWSSVLVGPLYRGSEVSMR